jgi:hypothetical protein
MTLTDLQRHALYLSSLKGGAVVVRKRTSGGKHVTTRHANFLERNGLVTRHDDVLLITAAGRDALKSPKPEDPPLYMSRSGSIRYRKLPNGRWAVDADADGNGDYTTNPARSIDQDGRSAVEVLVSPKDVARYAKDARAREHERLNEHGRSLDELSLDDRMDRAHRKARERRLDISRELRLIRFMVDNGRERNALQRLAQVEAKLGERAA